MVSQTLKGWASMGESAKNLFDKFVQVGYVP
jgi:hypothetical protein